tara:strand:+ start:267 stop:542 length:276 start_codon:yes stop_codon:yes gene_type:complete
MTIKLFLEDTLNLIKLLFVRRKIKSNIFFEKKSICQNYLKNFECLIPEIDDFEKLIEIHKNCCKVVKKELDFVFLITLKNNKLLYLINFAR